MFTEDSLSSGAIVSEPMYDGEQYKSDTQVSSKEIFFFTLQSYFNRSLRFLTERMVGLPCPEPQSKFYKFLFFLILMHKGGFKHQTLNKNDIKLIDQRINGH